MGWLNVAYIDMLRDLIEHARNHTEIILEPNGNGLVHLFEARGAGIKSSPDLKEISLEEQPPLTAREEAVRKWESNLDALEEFLEHVRVNLPEDSFVETLDKAEVPDPIEPVGP